MAMAEIAWGLGVGGINFGGKQPAVTRAVAFPPNLAGAPSETPRHIFVPRVGLLCFLPPNLSLPRRRAPPQQHHLDHERCTKQRGN